MSAIRWILAASLLGAGLYVLLHADSGPEQDVPLRKQGEAAEPGLRPAMGHNNSTAPKADPKPPHNGAGREDGTLPLIEGIPPKIGIQVEVFASETRAPQENILVRISDRSDARVLATLAEGVTDTRGRSRLGPFTIPSVTRENLHRRFLHVTLTSSAGVSNYTIEPIVLQRQAARQGRVGASAAAGPMWVIMRYPHPVGIGVDGRVLSALGRAPARAYVRFEGARKWTLCDERGGFSLRADEAGAHTLEVVVGLPGKVQETRREQVLVASGMEPVLVRLSGLEAISGKVVDPEGTAVSDIQLILTSEPDKVRSSLGPSSIPRSPTPTPHLIVHSDASGDFSFVGVEPAGSYRIWWRGDSGDMEQHSSVVLSGEADLRLVCRRHRLHVELRDAQSDEPLSGDVEVLEVNGKSVQDAFPVVESFWRRSSSGFCSPPGTRLKFKATARGYRSTVAVAEMPVDGWNSSRVIRLHPSRASGVVLLTCTDDRGRPLSNVPIQVVTPGSPRPLALLLKWQSRTLNIEGLEAGEYEIATRSPLGAPTAKRWHLYRPASLTHVVAEKGLSTAQLSVPLGGAVRLRIKAPRGKAEPARLRLVKGDGTIVPVVWYATGGEGTKRWRQGAGIGRATVLISSALPPADYELRVVTGTDRSARTLPVRVMRGEVTEERLDLDD